MWKPDFSEGHAIWSDMTSIPQKYRCVVHRHGEHTCLSVKLIQGGGRSFAVTRAMKDANDDLK